MEKLVSVIIASYNHEKYIASAIESVLNQTYQNIELIVEDDASTDHTVEVLKHIKDKRLKKIYAKKNRGAVRTFNHLMRMCHGDYIAVLGSDDIWYQEKLEKQINYLETHDVEAVFSMADIIDENGNIYKDDGNFSSKIFHADNLSRAKRMRLFYEVGNHLCHPSSVISKKAVEKIGLYNCTYRQLHDFEYWIRLINEFNIAILNENLVGYRRFQHENLSSVTTTNLIRHMNEHYHIIKEMFDIMDDQIFKEGFQDLFVNKHASSKEELFCEKFLLLLNLNIFGTTNKQIAINMLFEHPDSEKIIQTLEQKYHYTLNTFYQDTGKIYEQYPLSLLLEENDELKKLVTDKNNLEKELQQVYNSKSWKITKPLRELMGRLKK